MNKKLENTGFVCQNCGEKIPALTNGSYRNHCPKCLYSLHVDNIPGDRNSKCFGLMRPIGLTYKSGKGYQIVHKCEKCGKTSFNKTSEDEKNMPDDIEKISTLPPYSQ